MTDVIGTRPVGPAADLDAKYREEAGSFFFTGVQALVRAPLDQMRIDRRAGLRTAAFISGYQGSPLGGYDLELVAPPSAPRRPVDRACAWPQRRAGCHRGDGKPAGSTFPGQKFDGVVGIWYGKSPGLDRAGDAIRHAAYAGTSRTGGVLALTGDDPACKSSTLPSSSEWALADLHMPILHPGNVQEILDLALHGIALSRTSGLWSALKVVTAVADGSSNIEVGLDRIAPVIPELIWKGVPYVPKVTGRVGPPYTTPIETEIYEVRLELARMYGVENHLNRDHPRPPTPWFGIAAPGRNYHEVLEALHVLGLDAGRSASVTAFGCSSSTCCIRSIRQSCGGSPDGLEEILVIEEKRPFVEMLAPRRALRHGRRAAVSWASATPDGAALVPGSGALDADAARRPVAPATFRTYRRSLGSRRSPRRRPCSCSARSTCCPVRTPVLLFGLPARQREPRHPNTRWSEPASAATGWSRSWTPERFGTITGNTQMGGEGVAVGRHRALRRDRPLHPEPR